MVLKMMSDRGIVKFFRTYFDDMNPLEAHIMNLAEMIALRRIKEEVEEEAEEDAVDSMIEGGM